MLNQSGIWSSDGVPTTGQLARINFEKILCASRCISLTGSVFAASICPDTESLRSAWKSFRAAASADKPAIVVTFYKFPLQLLGRMDGERTIKISGKIFTEKYATLFVKNEVGTEVENHESLKKSTDIDYIPPVTFSAETCALRGPVRISDYNFAHVQKRGWFIESLYYGGDHYQVKNNKSLNMAK